MTVMYPRTGAVPSRTSATAARAAAGSPSARQITARALRISPELASSSSSAATKARASPVIPSRAWVAISQRVTRLASACDPCSCDPRYSAAPNSSSASWWRPRPACSIPAVWCSRSVMSGPVSVCRACLVRCSHRSPSSNSPVQTSVPASIISAGAIAGSAPQPCRSARAIASRQRRWVVANEWRTSDANPSCARQATSR